LKLSKQHDQVMLRDIHRRTAASHRTTACEITGGKLLPFVVREGTIFRHYDPQRCL
jgi:hypothetical protein